MRVSKLSLIAAGALACAAPALAQTTVTTTTTPVVTHTQDHSAKGAAVGGLTGAATGAVVGGPIGAAVGFAAGSMLGAATNVPEPVVSYVRTNQIKTVRYDGEVVVGATLPDTVVLAPVPDSDFYYSYVNDAPVIVDPQTRAVVHVVN